MNVNKTLINRSIPVLLLSLSFARSISPVQASDQLRLDLQTDIWNQIINDTNNSSSVANTGDNNTNSTETDEAISANLETNNQADISQSVNAYANTGYNEASRNISIGGNAGVITTGDALISTTALVEANTAAAGITFIPSNNSGPTSTLSTGDDSSADNTQSSDTTILVSGNNDALISQSTNATANTGYNIADRNISLGGSAGVINTGNAGVVTNYLVAANNTVFIVGGETNGNGPGSGASIIVTGDNNRYSAASSLETDLAVQSDSSATVNQSCGSSEQESRLLSSSICQAITGGNTADRNISRNGDAGVITTGDAILSIFLTTDVNSGELVVGVGSSPTSAGADVINTGSNNNFDSSTSQDTSVGVDQNQDANITQTVNALADTGHNTANRNISFGGDAGVITTGNAYILTRLSALANTETSAISLLSSPLWGSN